MQRYIIKVCLILLLVIGGLSIMSGAGAASSLRQDSPVYIYFFWGEGCPHCAAAKPFLEELAQRYPQVEVVAFEVYNSPDNQALLKELAAAHGFEPRYVPTIFVGDQHWEGYTDQLRGQIEASVRACVEGWCPDAGVGVVPGHETAPETPVTPEELCSVETSECDEPDGIPAVTPQYEAGQTSQDTARKLQAILFYGDLSCGQCEATRENDIMQSGFRQIGSDSGIEALQLLRVLEAGNPDFEVIAYEVWVEAAHATRFRDLASIYNVETPGVPTIFIGDRVWQGFDTQTADEVQAYVERCLADDDCPDLLDEQDSGSPASGTLENAELPPSPPSEANLTIPLLGTVSLGEKSLWVSTALISFVDGFNPCSLWVLSILIALTLRTGSRKRIFMIGLIYITVTAGVYVLFIAGLFTVLSVVSFLGWIQAAVSLLALFFAAVNIKDYFWYKEGLSFTIADEKKPGIYKRIRRVLNAGNSFWALAGATVALGAGVSLVEFSCTAGFPVIWTNLVAAQNVAPLTFALLLLLYMVIYQIDELVIFGVAVATLKASRLEEKHGRILKLIGGTMMLSLAGVMLIKPALMNELGTSLLIFGAAIAVALLVLIIHRRLLPKLGIYIGTELTASTEEEIV